MLLPIVAVVIVTGGIAFAQARPQRRTRNPAGPKPVTPSQAGTVQKPKYKAIFEPVNYPEDVDLLSVYFSDEKNGWAAGGANEMKGGVILHTADAGAHWTVQTGDTQSGDRAFRELRFTNERLGFAVQRTGQASNLFRTEDGEHWLPVGKI